MKLLRYKGYYGSIEASPEDNCLYGKIEFISPLVNYEGETISELKSAFENAVDDYIKTCEQAGREPEQTVKGSFNVRIGSELHKKALVCAKDNGISLNDFVKKSIENAIHC